jgi:superfamily II DNA helicase RecQ
MPLSTITPKHTFSSPVAHEILRSDVSISLFGHNTDNDALAHIRELFTFSPFGLGCRQCGEHHYAKIKLEERSIRDHLRKHHMDSRMSTVQSVLNGFTKQVLIAKESGTIEPYRSDQKTYSGYSCNCGQVFPRKGNALRHCLKVGCDATKLQEVDLFKLCCGSYVSQAQVDLVFAPRITKQFNYSKARATLLPFLPKREIHDHTYTHMYTPLITQCGGSAQFVTKIRNDFTAIHAEPCPLYESMLTSIHEQAETWLLKFAQMNIKMVPGNLRAALQTFEGGEVDEVSQRCTYTMQHDPTTLLVELKKLLSFVYRRGFFSGKPFNHQDGFAIAYFLKDLMLEIPPSVQSHPLAVEFCLMWGFRVEKTDSNIKMVSCDTVSSLFSKIASVLKAAICSVVCSFSEDAFTIHGPALVTAVRKSHVLHCLSPMVRQLREMHHRLPKRRKTTLDDTGNIVVDQFYFPFDTWSQIVPKTVILMKLAISNLADGIWWEPVVDVLTDVQVNVCCDTGDLFIADVNPVWKQDSLFSLDHFDHLTALLEMSFHGFGGGSARLNELRDPTMFHCLFTNGTVYYTLSSLKGFKSTSQRTRKEIERKLPPVISRYFLLFRSLIRTKASMFTSNSSNDSNRNHIFPTRINPSVNPSVVRPSHIIRDVFSLAAIPSMTQVRHFWAGVSNFVTGGHHSPNHFVSSNIMGASKMGHSSLTHATIYSSQQVGSEETHFNAYHFAIGDTSYQISKSISNLSLADLRNAMRLRYPTAISPSNGHDHYLSIQQKELVEFGYGANFNNKAQHCIALLAPGEGKSESYIIPTIARQLANQKSKTIIHVSPFRFLAGYQFAMASAAFEKLSLKSSICVFSGRDITSDGPLPEELRDKDNLPSLLFLNLDAVSNLFKYFSEVLKSWVDVLDRIVIDEVHTILSEMNFRDKYKVYSELPSLGVPIVVLSGSLPIFAISRFAKQLGLSKTDNLSDVKVILGSHVVGRFPQGFKIKVSISSKYVYVAAHFVKTKLESRRGLAAVHVVVAEKKDGIFLLQQLSTRCRCKFVSSDSTQEEVNQTATEWSKGQFDVLISTTMGLVGNENPSCRHLVCVGYLYDSMQIVQFLGRLRDHMRTDFGQILFAVPDDLSDHRIIDDNHKYTRLLNEGFISAQDHQNFTTVMTSSGVQDWLSDSFLGEKGCAMNLLSVSFGRPTTGNCGACPFCCSIPLTYLQTEATQRIQLAATNEIATQRVLLKLATACLVCGNPACRGIPLLRGSGSKLLPENAGVCFQWKMCYACGVSTHDRKLCPFKKEYTHNRACCECWVFKGVSGATKHETNNCPVKGRLRRLLSHNFLQAKVTGTFQVYIEEIYTSAESFCKFLATQESKIATSRHQSSSL